MLADGTSLTLARTLARAARRSARADDIGALKTWGYLSAWVVLRAPHVHDLACWWSRSVRPNGSDERRMESSA
ncbi:hypothetical protein BRN51_15565 [Xanthomonas oryzae pv. oryzae]|nr:hypothetical protein BRN51_15565 [Xanthomonas oryzae pv. oryzae]RBF81702.1 hypothetical protein BRM95_20625 [Xanthomonas oryzae pv. oryzae]RBK60976.1 hypothetical protein BRN49_17455 [Xanthomonas oryzae pv. oryzae]